MIITTVGFVIVLLAMPRQYELRTASIISILLVIAAFIADSFSNQEAAVISAICAVVYAIKFATREILERGEKRKRKPAKDETDFDETGFAYLAEPFEKAKYEADDLPSLPPTQAPSFTTMKR